MSQVFTVLRDGMRFLNVLASGLAYVVPSADNEPERQTYGAAILGLSLASNPTDILTIQGAAGKVVRVKSITLNGLSASLAAYPLQLIRRAAANTAGSFTTLNAFKHDTSDPNAAAVVNAYTANPTGLGAASGGIHAGRVVAATASNLDRVAFQYTWQNDKAIVLNGASEWLAINMAGAALAAATTMDIDLLWTEEG